MNTMATRLFLLIGLIAATGPTLAQDANALFSVPVDATKVEHSQRHYTPYPIVSAVAKSIKSEQKKGRLNRWGYRLPPTITPLQLIENYQRRIEDLNGKITFQCANQSCGDVAKLTGSIKPIQNMPKSEPQLLNAQLELNNKSLWVQIFISASAKYTAVQIDQLELIDKAPLLLRANADYLNSHVSEIELNDQSHKDKKGSHDHPLLTRIPGAYINAFEQYQFGQSTLLTGINKNALELEPQEGTITDILYQLPRSYSEYEIHKNYHKALTELGFVERFHCHGSDCPDKDTMLSQLKLLGNNGFDEHQFYSLYVLNRAAGDIHVMSYVIGYTNRLISELRIIEEATLVDDRIAIDLDSLTSKIAQSGHVALDGLLFEFDSNKMLPEAEEVIEVVATYLKANPKQGFYVVGHTDDQGRQEYNQKLSQKRANAVRQRLVLKHGISEKQLVAIGNGEHAPVASNATKQGKKLNRRVELVLRSDGR